MPNTPETFARPDTALMERTFRETVLPIFNEALAAKGFRLFDYLSSEVLGEESQLANKLIRRGNFL